LASGAPSACAATWRGKAHADVLLSLPRWRRRWPPARDPPGAHLAFIHARAEHFVMVGPLKRTDGFIIGSLLIVEAAD
jgi:hypothetical protein